MGLFSFLSNHRAESAVLRLRGAVGRRLRKRVPREVGPGHCGGARRRGEAALLHEVSASADVSKGC